MQGCAPQRASRRAVHHGTYNIVPKCDSSTRTRAARRIGEGFKILIRNTVNHVTLLRKCCSTEPVAQFGGLGTQSDTDDLSTTIHVCENVRCSGPAPMESNEVVTAAVVQDLGLTSSRLTRIRHVALWKTGTFMAPLGHKLCKGETVYSGDKSSKLDFSLVRCLLFYYSSYPSLGPKHLS